MKPNGKATVNWNYKAVEHKGYTDLGKYVIDFGMIDQDGLERGRLVVNSRVDTLTAPACTGIVKHNSKGEVIMGRNQDLELSNYPVFIAHYVGGKYEAVSFNYNNYGLIRYDEYQKGVELPENFREMMAAASCDAFNDAGLYIQADMRTAKGHMSSGTNPGAKRVCMGTLAAFVSQNAATVKEALAYLNTLDIFSPGATDDGQSRAEWDGGYMIGDATGEYGLVEFGRNGVYFTPYQTFQSNYYIHPLLSERAVINHGHGRASTLLDGLMDVQTEQEILENQKKARYHFMMEEPSWKYYSDVESLANVNERRTLSPEEQAALFDAEIIHAGGIDDNLEKLAAYYAGDESGLRGDETIWMGSITSGVNCATKHAIIQMWEKDDTTIEIQW